MNIRSAGVKQLSGILAGGQLSSVQLTRACLDRIAAKEGSLHAFIAVDEDLAMRSAADADRRLREGNAPLLCGIPYAAKDNICTAALPTTCASNMLRGYMSPFDAFALTRLDGSVLAGKTNMDEFAMGSSTENSAFGVTRNPHDPDRVPGGSSGGSACAVASGEVPFALGSDTGGSVRQPAAFCGIVGMRPTYGAVSRRGLVAFASSLDQIGPMTRSVEDNAIVMEAITAHDPMDATSAAHPHGRMTERIGLPVEGLRIGLPREMFDTDMDEGVRAAVLSAAETFRRMGADVREVSLPFVSAALPAYYVLSGAEASSNLARYDGIRYGHRAEGCVSLEELYIRSRSEGFGREVKRRIMTGTHVLSAGYSERYYQKAQQVRRSITAGFDACWQDTDLLLSPTAPETAFPIGAKQSPVAMYAGDIHTVPAAMAGIPALSMPCGSSGGLPVGLQLMGPAFSEPLIYQAAFALEREIGTCLDLFGEVD